MGAPLSAKFTAADTSAREMAKATKRIYRRGKTGNASLGPQRTFSVDSTWPAFVYTGK